MGQQASTEAQTATTVCTMDVWEHLWKNASYPAALIGIMPREDFEKVKEHFGKYAEAKHEVSDLLASPSCCVLTLLTATLWVYIVACIQIPLHEEKYVKPAEDDLNALLRDMNEKYMEQGVTFNREHHNRGQQHRSDELHINLSQAVQSQPRAQQRPESFNVQAHA